MRTTLKRGIGRSRGATPNGRAAVPASRLTAVSRYLQPQPRARYLRGSGLFFGRVLLVICVIGGGIAGGLSLWGHDALGHTKAHSIDVKRSQRWLSTPELNQPVIALIVGFDQRAGIEHTDVSRSDTLMLLRADPLPDGDKALRNISLLSFPRDLRVPLYCPGRSPVTGKINAAFSLCGAEGSLLTVKELTGLPINYVIKVNFRGFTQIVSKVGGVWVDVDHRYFNDNSGGYDRYATIDLQPGYQKLSGSKALDYVRYRHGDSDLYRIARQQAFIRAFKERVTQLSLVDMPRIVRVMTDNVEVGKNGGGSLSATTLYSYAKLISGLPSGHFFQARIDDVTQSASSSDLIASDETLRAAIEKFAAPDVSVIARAADANGVARAKKPSAPTPEETTVLVLNGSNVEGLARDTSYGLAQRGYQTVETANGQAANVPGPDLWHTIVYYDPAQARALRAAEEVAKLFGDAETKSITPAIARLANGAMVIAALGQTFDGILPPIRAREVVPERQPPKTTINPELTRPYLRYLRRKLPFRLEVPTIVENSSSLAHVSGVRRYKLDRKHKAVRITFQLGYGGFDYWGIQETDWADAPVLAGSHFSRRIHRRDFDFYYSGAHLHMVVLRENGATYWVVNSLTDKLSNETMIAIAKGLRPLPQ